MMDFQDGVQTPSLMAIHELVARGFGAENIKHMAAGLEWWDEVEDFEKNFRFTETSKHQFREIYRKWKIMFPTKRLDPSEFLNSQPKDIILQLEKEILINAENWNAL